MNIEAMLNNFYRNLIFITMSIFRLPIKRVFKQLSMTSIRN